MSIAGIFLSVKFRAFFVTFTTLTWYVDLTTAGIVTSGQGDVPPDSELITSRY